MVQSEYDGLLLQQKNGPVLVSAAALHCNRANHSIINIIHIALAQTRQQQQSKLGFIYLFIGRKLG